MPGGGRGRPGFTSGAMGGLQHLCGLLLHMCLYLLAASVTLSHARASPRLWLGSGVRPGSAFGPGSGSGSVSAPAEALRRMLLGAKATHQRVRPELRLLVCTAEYFGLLPHWMSRSGRRSGHAHTQFLEPLPWEIVESGYSWEARPRPNLPAGEYSTLKEQGHAPHAAEVEANISRSKAEEQLAGQPSFSQQEAYSLVKRLDAEAVISHVSVGSPVFVLHVLEEASRAALAAWQEGVAAAVAAAARTPAPTPLHQQKQEREPSLPRVALEAARAALRAATRALWRARLRRGDEAEAAAAAPGAAAEARVAALRAALRAWSRSPSGRAAQWLLRQLMADPLMRCARAYVTARLWQWAGA